MGICEKYLNPLLLENIDLNFKINHSKVGL